MNEQFIITILLSVVRDISGQHCDSLVNVNISGRFEVYILRTDLNEWSCSDNCFYKKKGEHEHHQQQRYFPFDLSILEGSAFGSCIVKSENVKIFILLLSFFAQMVQSFQNFRN